MSPILTTRQEQIVQQLANGATVKDVADDLGISITTVQTHIKRIYRKLDVRNRVELVRWLLLARDVPHSGD